MLVLISMLTLGVADDEQVLAWLATGETLRARQALEEKIRLPDERAESFLYLGALLRTEGELEAAERVFAEGVDRFPEHVTLLGELGMTLAWSQRFDRALALYDRAMELAPDDASTRLQRARVRRWSGELKESTEDYHVLTARDPTLVEAWVGLGAIARQDWRLAESRQHLDRALQLDPNHLEARTEMEHLQAADRYQARVGGGFVTFVDGTTSGQIEADLGIQWRESRRILLEYRSNVAAGFTENTGNTFDHGAAVQLDLRLSPKWGAVVGYELRTGETLQHRAIARLSLAWTSRWTALAGVRPGTTSEGDYQGTLADAGVQYALGDGSWWMAQLFFFDEIVGPETLSAVLTHSRVLLPGLEVRAGVGAGRAAGSFAWNASGALNYAVTRQFELFARYELFDGPVTRHSLVSGIGARF
ncbi:MAG: tetratricopeptide repeat protein [Myxococcota bacterium]